MGDDQKELGGNLEDAAELHAQRVLELTRQMLRSARQQEWESVMERDRLRARQIELIPEHASRGATDRIRQCLNEALEIEKEVRSLMEAERDRLGVEVRKEQQQRNASTAYRQASDM
jgi:hypothetical protein